MDTRCHNIASFLSVCVALFLVSECQNNVCPVNNGLSTTASVQPPPGSEQQIAASAGNEIRIFTLKGELLETHAVPYPDGQRPATETARDLLSANGTFIVYNGTFDPYLSTYSDDQWYHITCSGWSTVNNVSYGGIGMYKKYYYITDMRTYGEPEDLLNGIVRFNSRKLTAERFAEGIDFIDLTIGSDNLLYALKNDERSINIYDPLSTDLVTSVYLDAPVRGIAVSADAKIYGASWNDNIYLFDSYGETISYVRSGVYDLIDIDISGNGLLLAGGRNGDILLMDESLAIISTFNVGFLSAFVAFHYN